MIHNGTLPTVQAAIYTCPVANQGTPRSGSNKTVNFFRIANESGAARKFTIFLNVNGTARAITPVNVALTIGAAYDDVPTFQLPPGATVEGVADDAGVSWTINAE